VPARLLAVACLLSACGSGTTGPAPISFGPPSGSIVRVLAVTATAGFRHDSIAAATATLRNLASSNQYSVTVTEDLSLLSTSHLSGFDVVMFVLTSGDLPLTAAAKSALIDFVSSGKGFVGVHSAADTLYEWPDYGRLVGAYFREHPWTRLGTIDVEDPSHPAAAGIGSRFSIHEEFYTFRENPRGRVHVLLSLDAASVGAIGDYPLAWSHPFGSGRAYYNALGHFHETWNDSRFQRQLVNAIRWTSGR
jgi:type 1 glutamine amidotransferase